MSEERLKEIQQYRANCRVGLGVPDVGYAHEAVDELLRELVAAQMEVDSLEADIKRLIYFYSLAGV